MCRGNTPFFVFRTITNLIEVATKDYKITFKGAQLVTHVSKRGWIVLVRRVDVYQFHNFVPSIYVCNNKPPFGVSKMFQNLKLKIVVEQYSNTCPRA